MKMRLFSMVLTLLFISLFYLPNTYAQYPAYMQFGLRAQARLGKGSIREIQYSPDGTRLAVASSIGIWLYDAQTGKELDLFTGHTDDVLSVSFSPDGLPLASGERWDSTVRLWDVATGDQKQVFTGHTSTVFSVSFSPDGLTLASGSNDNTVRLWDVATGDQKQWFIGHTLAVNSVSFSPDGRTLASGSPDGTVLLWELP